MDRKNYRVLKRNDDRGYSFLLTNKNRKDGCLIEKGIIATLDEDDKNNIKPNYTTIADYFGCLGIFTSLDQIRYLVIVTTADWITKLIEIDIFRIKAVQFIEMSDKQHDEGAEVHGIHKLLESGFFYFGKGAKGKSANLSVNIQNRHLGLESDDTFIWNKYLLTQFKQFAITNDWYTAIICGSVMANTIYSSAGNVKICVISRVNCQRIGTRFASRGIDDNGNVANFVETEQCFLAGEGQLSASYVQVRGSVPLFWEQPGIQVGSHKIKFSRSLELSAVAYDRHISRLLATYNRVHIVNLLGHSAGERKLALGFRECHDNSRFVSDVKLTSFDYHKEGGNRSRNIDKLKKEIAEFIDETHFCWIMNGEMVQRQFGVVRTNCVDCLDRTNAVQTLIGLDFIVDKQLTAVIDNGKAKLATVLDSFKSMWKANGDGVSLIYAGSGALGTGNRLADAQKSVKRTYLANFSDSNKNSSISALLRPNTLGDEDSCRAKRLLPTTVLNQEREFLTDLVTNSLAFAEKRPLQVFVGTWNVNGGKNFASIAHKHQSVADWLLDLPVHTPGHSTLDPDTLTDIFAIGFQEIVDLTASNIVNAKSGNQHQWAQHLLIAISKRTDYMLLSTVQLVGICLFVFIKNSLAPHITEVSASSVKTGLKGTAGNKGAVAISFQLYQSSFCFVCSHFAAGQTNLKERNDDFRDIYRLMKFLNGTSINCHDFVYWCGDFNYRIDLPITDVKQLITDRNYSALQQYDQLYLQRQQGKVFDKFKEGAIAFAPTYKYDIFCDDYDTSEKCRVPAWTDRVLWKVNVPMDKKEELCRLLVYNRAELKTSDHRPVGALFSVQALQINKKQRHDQLMQKMLKRGPGNSTIAVNVEQFKRASDIPDDLLNMIIKSFNEVGEIILVRFSGSDLLFNYGASGSAVDIMNKFDKTYIKDTEYFIRVQPLDKDWQQNISKILEEDTSDSVEEYPPLLTELITNTNQRASILREEYFSDDDDEDDDDNVDVKEKSVTSHIRTRSCSPPRKGQSESLRPEAKVELISSYEDLSTKDVVDNVSSKRPPPIRPPPMTHSDIFPKINSNDELMSPKAVVEPSYETNVNESNSRPMFVIAELDDVISDRPVPLRPAFLTKNEEELSMRPVPPVPRSTSPVPQSRK